MLLKRIYALRGDEENVRAYDEKAKAAAGAIMEACAAEWGEHMAEVASVPLSRIAALNDGRLSVLSDAVMLVTDSRQWAYSAEARFNLAGGAHLDRTVKVELKVESGVLGVGWLLDDGSWAARASANSDVGPTELRLNLASSTAGGSLIFDNWTEGGNPARGVITGIKVVQEGRC